MRCVGASRYEDRGEKRSLAKLKSRRKRNIAL
jgi:hypothetical protein